MNAALFRWIFLFSIVTSLAEAAIYVRDRPMLFAVDDDAVMESSALASSSRPKRSFDRLDSSPLGFSASARAFVDDELSVIPRAVEERPLLFRPRKRLFYHLNDGYLFGRR